MRILLANHTPLTGSGSGTYTALVAKGLGLAGHKVAVLTPPGAGQVAHLDTGVEIFVVSELRGEFPTFTTHPLSYLRYEMLTETDLDALTDTWDRNFQRIISQWKPDIIHTQHLWVVSEAATRSSLPVFVTSHGSELALARQHPLRTGCAPGKSPGLRSVIFVSEFVASMGTSLLPKRIPHVTLYNAYDAEIFHIKRSTDITDNPTLGFAGRLVTYKNCDHFLRAVALAARHQPRLRAWIAGDGPEHAHLASLATKLGIDGIVTFLGQRRAEQLADLFRASNAVAVCSYEEPLPTTALEAAACGTPVLAAISGGLREIIFPPHITGYPWGAIEALADLAVKHCRTPRTYVERQATNGFIEQRYSLHRYVEAIDTVYGVNL